MTLDGAVFDRGVYRINLSGLKMPDKPFVEDIVDEHRFCKDLVEGVLDRCPETRDDDMSLILKVWSLQGVKVDLDSASLDVIFSTESIRRSRQRIQNTEGKFLPTTYAVAKRRRINEKLLRAYYGRGDLCEKYD